MIRSLPVNVWKAIIGHCLVDGLLDEVGCLAHLACPLVVDDRLCLRVGSLAALLGVSMWLTSRTLVIGTWLKTLR
jgi:hypothetical protein